MKDLHADLVGATKKLSIPAQEIFRYLLDFDYGSDIPDDQITKDLSISRATFYRYLKELRDKNVLLYQRHAKKAS